jgi:LacI family transcriptional regulator
LKRVTINDIAELAKVSAAAVSMVLNDAPSRISQAKRTEIIGLAERHGYTPNLVGRSLATGKTRTLGLVIPDIENVFFSAFAKKIEGVLSARGYSLLLVCNGERFENDKRAVRLLLNHKVDGLLLVLSNEAPLNTEAARALLSGIDKPFVVLDRLVDGIGYKQIGCDFTAGQYMAVKHLIDKGHRKIGYIAGTRNTYSGGRRFDGYIKAVEENGLQAAERLARYGDFQFLSAYNLAGELIGEGATAIAAANDIMAYGVLKRAAEMKLSIPGDLAVIGYGDFMFSEMLPVPLTTVKHDIALFAEKAVEELIRSIGGDDLPFKILLEPRFIQRQSV